jgi:hypothetical protein
VATTKRIRRIQGEREPKLPLSKMSPRERLEALNVLVRDLKPLLRDMPVQKLEAMRVIDRDSQHTADYRDGLRWDTYALCVYQLLWSKPNESPQLLVAGHWLALTTKAAWIYWDAEGRGSDDTGYTTSSSFSLASKRSLLGLLQDEPGERIAHEVCTKLLRFASNVVRSHEQRAEETRRVFEQAQVLTEHVVDLKA